MLLASWNGSTTLRITLSDNEITLNSVVYLYLLYIYLSRARCVGQNLVVSLSGAGVLVARANW